MKQISKKVKSEFLKESNNSHSAIIARREIEILNSLNSINSPDEENSSNSSSYLRDQCMIKLVDYFEDNNDIWLVFEKGGKTLTSLIFKIKGEFLGNERIYSIRKGKFLVSLFQDLNNLRSFMRKILLFINFLNSNGIVHCDLKPENILIDYEEVNGEKVYSTERMKIIDLGSAFFINNPDNFSSNTPEYMSPEITELMEKNASAKEVTSFLKNLKQWPWCIDIWSLGVTVLELCLSCPLWMSYKAKVIINGKVKLKKFIIKLNYYKINLSNFLDNLQIWIIWCKRPKWG